MLDPEVALSNAFYIGYATPNTGVLNNPEYAEMRENPYLYPEKEDMPDTEYFHNLPQESLLRLSELWNEIRVHGNDITDVYIGFAFVAAAAVIFSIRKSYIRKKREYWYSFPEQ